MLFALCSVEKISYDAKHGAHTDASFYVLGREVLTGLKDLVNKVPFCDGLALRILSQRARSMQTKAHKLGE